ncbi:MAG: site-specific tyrosine recombinase XerD [Actinomycetota bacterium]
MEDIANFLDYLRFERQLSKNTLMSYTRDIEKYFAFLDNHKIDYLKIDHQQILEFFKWLNITQSASSVSRILSCLRNFYKFLIREEKISHNPFADIRNPKTPRKLLEVLSEAEVEKFLDSIPQSTEFDLRDKAMFELLYSCGLRVSEIVGLKMVNVDLEEGLLVFIGKGDKERITPIGDKAMDALKKYIFNARHKIEKARQEYVFLNRFGRRISRQGFWKIMKKYARRLGLGKKLYPHIFRHSFATHMLERGADIRTVQELLGHSSISTTEIYTTVTKKHLKDTYFRYHPREK